MLGWQGPQQHQVCREAAATGAEDMVLLGSFVASGEEALSRASRWGPFLLLCTSDFQRAALAVFSISQHASAGM